jgi:hypothetical protein
VLTHNPHDAPVRVSATVPSCVVGVHLAKRVSHVRNWHVAAFSAATKGSTPTRQDSGGGRLRSTAQQQPQQVQMKAAFCVLDGWSTRPASSAQPRMSNA